MAKKRTRIIYYGDNLEILRDYIPDESVDLVYLDPPFKSQQAYNVLFRTVKGEPAAAQVRAFTDTWKWDLAAKAAYERLMEDPRVPGKVSEMVRAFYQFLGPSEMLAYLVMMTPRLLELHRVLKPTGSLYLHCDPAASHYLKLVLDTIFAPSNFRNEIIWQRTAAHSDARRYARVTDRLLFYSKSSEFVWNTLRSEYEESYIQERYHYIEEGTGRRFWPNTMTAAGPGPARVFRGIQREPPPGTHWRFSQEKIDELERQGRIYYSKTGMPYVKSYLDEREGKAVTELWNDIVMSKSGPERLGYPTQKPLSLLNRIIQASTNPGDVVLDPFCGCGTALVAAEELERSWIGIDITYLAVDVMARRLRDHFPGISFEIRGQPQDEEGARALKEKDRFQFQVWALSLLGAQPLDQERKGADRGIDGYLTFLTGRDQYERAIVQVKSGHVLPGIVRDLRGVLEREKAPFALLITLEPPTEGMQREAADAGFYQVPATGEEVPRLQILTVQDLLRGKRPKVPTTQVSPVPTAPRIKRAGGRQLPLKEKQ